MTRSTFHLFQVAISGLLWTLLAQAGEPCPEGYAPDAQGKCTACAAGYVKNAKTGACKKPPSCPTGQVLVVDKCFPACTTGYAHDSSGKCTLCADGFIKDQKSGACKKPPTCTPPQVLVIDRCFPACPAGYAHDNSGKCTLCADGYLKDKSGACKKPAG